MAKLTNYFREGYALQIEYIISPRSTQNILKNTSTITFKAQLVSGGDIYTIISNLQKNGWLTINGTKYAFTFMADLAANQQKTLFTKTLDIPHNSDGTKTLSLQLDLELYVYLSKVLWTDISFPTSLTLNKIPRTSTMSLSNSSATIGSTLVTVNIASEDKNFTHKVYCKLGGYNKQININEESATSISFTPDKTIANQLPNSTNGNATIEVQTYVSGSKLGSVSKSITLQVPTYMVPQISDFKATPVAAGAASSFGYVKGLSKCYLSMGTVTGSYSSTIKSYSISGGGFSSTSDSLTTGVLYNAGSITFTAKVTDSRGRTTTATVPITIYDYTTPTINTFIAQRCISDGTLSDEGTYISVKSIYSYSSVNNQNAITASVKYKKSTDSIWIDGGSISNNVVKVIGTGSISTDNLFDVMITVSDRFKSISKTASVSTSYAILDILKGGKGIAVGKIAEFDNVIDINMDAKFRLPILADKGIQVASSAFDGTTRYDSNNIPSGLSIIKNDSDTAGLPYIYTTVLSVKHSIYRQFQIAARNNGNSLYFRAGHEANVGGTGNGWSPWRTVYHDGNKPSASDVGAYAKSDWDYSKGTNGYCKLPTGIIIQWGSVVITPTAAGTITSSAITFPITFPSSVRAVQVTPNSAAPDKLTTSGGAISTSGFTVYLTRTNTVDTGVFWFAVGY